jgi:hypothetical protein
MEWLIPAILPDTGKQAIHNLFRLMWATGHTPRAGRQAKPLVLYRFRTAAMGCRTGAGLYGGCSGSCSNRFYNQRAAASGARSASETNYQGQKECFGAFSRGPEPSPSAKSLALSGTRQVAKESGGKETVSFLQQSFSNYWETFGTEQHLSSALTAVCNQLNCHLRFSAPDESQNPAQIEAHERSRYGDETDSGTEDGIDVLAQAAAGLESEDPDSGDAQDSRPEHRSL